MASNAFAGVGAVFQRWNGSSWVDIAEIISIEGPTMDLDVIDVTSLDTADGYNEFITGFAQGGTVVLGMNFTRATYELMKNDFEIDVSKYYNIILSDDESTTLTFQGLVTEIPLSDTADDKITADVTIQISSEVTLDVGSSVPSSDVPVEASSDSGYDSDLETYWVGLSTPLSTAQKDRIQTMVTSIKTGCSITLLSQLFDTMYLFANETEEAALRNMVKRAHDCIDPSSADFDLPIFVQYRGFHSQFNYGHHIDTDYNQQQDTVNAGITDCAYGIYVMDEIAPAGGIRVWGSGPYNEFIIRNTTTEYARGCVNGVGSFNYFENDSDLGYGEGFYITGRSGNNLYSKKNFGPLIGPVVSTAGAGYNYSVLVLTSRDAAGNAANFSNSEVGFFFISKMVTLAQADAIAEAIETYLESVGMGEISSEA